MKPLESDVPPGDSEVCPPVPIKFLTPMPEQNEAGRNCVEQTALRDKHGERETFPGDIVRALVIDELKSLEKFKSDHAAVEQEPGHAKYSAPAIESTKGGQRSKQADPDETGDELNPLEAEQSIK